MWSPREDARETTEIGRYMRWLESERGLRFGDYHELLRWSVDDLEGFWGSVWDFFGVRAETPYERVLASDDMPGAVWFPGARLNYAEHLIGTDDDVGKTAVVADGQTRDRVELTFGDLRAGIARARAGLKELGVGPGDRVVAYMPNIPETLIAFAATASLGAIWASCAPELGARAVVDRLGQLEPDVLLAVGGYGFRDRQIDRRGELETIRAALPTVRHVVDVPYGPHSVPDAMAWDELCANDGPLEFDPVDFDHPLFVLFSSGTTGKPKAIVHGHGGILLEQFKANAFMWDMKPGGRLLWFSTTSWMMWNALVSALLTRTSIVMLDGDPAWPDPGWQWRLAAELRPTTMGAAPCLLDGVPQGRARPRPRARPVLDPGVRDRRLAAGARGLPLDGGAARARHAPAERQRRHRRVLRHRRRQPDAAGLGGRDVGPQPGRRRGRVRPGGQADRRRVGRAGDRAADALDAGRALGRRGRLARCEPPTTTTTPASGGTATGSASPSGARA